MSEASDSVAVDGDAPGQADRAAQLRAFASTYALLPLRLFLGVTFVYAALDKLSDSHFLAGAGDPASFVSQTQAARTVGSPISFLLGPACSARPSTRPPCSPSRSPSASWPSASAPCSASGAGSRRSAAR
jgi:hypothetical protein